MSVSLTVMTFNLHEDQTEDSPYSWEKRRDLCISVITSYSPMILCTQQGIFASAFIAAVCVWILLCRCDLLGLVIWVSFHLCFGGGFLFF